ncbi:MAG TPA: hypothetical protein VFW34_06500 [Candidatus Rubrimentiphilum sp.]|nr:hypothetical protein [Candidatus Rubrimentiphilum sp.]
MCNGVSRGWFLAAAGAAALPLLAAPASGAELPAVPDGLAAGNARAATIARGSEFIQKQYAGAMHRAGSIANSRIRADVLGILTDPAPRYARKYPTAASRTALRDALARQGFVKPGDPVSGIFPPGTERAGIVQPFWSAAGSAYDSHHSYPGGLLVHEFFNASMAEHFAKTYDAIYFGGGATVDRDIAIAAAFYHDIMKTVVFQFNDDGTLLPELTIAGTGGHHCLSGAEAIVRGHDARFVTVLLSAHAAPSLGDEAKVAQWCRASAAIAGVDPVEYGLVDRNGALAALPSIECFVNFLSDHDYVLSVEAVQRVSPLIEALATPPGDAEKRWWRHRVLSNASAIALYEAATRGEDVFEQAVRRAAAFANDTTI